MRVAPIDHNWWYDRWLRTFDPGLIDCTHLNRVDGTSVQVCIVSYSCLPNIKSAINSHNRKIRHPPVKSQNRTCNCIKKTDCPLQEKCLSENTLYHADISFEKLISFKTQTFKMQLLVD